MTVMSFITQALKHYLFSGNFSSVFEFFLPSRDILAILTYFSMFNNYFRLFLVLSVTTLGSAVFYLMKIQLNWSRGRVDASQSEGPRFDPHVSFLPILDGCICITS